MSHRGAVRGSGTGWALEQDWWRNKWAAAPTQGSPGQAEELGTGNTHLYVTALHMLPTRELVGVGVQGWRPEFLSTIYPSISVPEQSWQAWVVLTVLWALHRPCHSGLCSQGHWKVGKGEQNSREMVTGNVPGRKGRSEWEAAVGRDKQEWRVEAAPLSLGRPFGVGSHGFSGSVLGRHLGEKDHREPLERWSHNSGKCASRLQRSVYDMEVWGRSKRNHRPVLSCAC